MERGIRERERERESRWPAKYFQRLLKVGSECFVMVLADSLCVHSSVAVAMVTCYCLFMLRTRTGTVVTERERGEPTASQIFSVASNLAQNLL